MALKSLSRCETGIDVTSMTPSEPPANCATMNPSAMRIPPAATNGIMYETPVMSHCRILVPTPAFRSTFVTGAADGRCRRRPGGHRRASTAATAAAMTPGASCTAFLTPTSMNGLPANRSLSLTSRSAA